MRYIIGIDLGTTNCCVSYIDTQDAKYSIHPFRLPQLIDPGYIEARSTLPSFCYLSREDEWPAGSLTLPWSQNQTTIIGSMAQTHGAKVPTRLVQSAKSWLCHPAASRRDKILPIEEESNQKISPIEATASYLKHIKEAWNHQFAKNPDEEFEQQEIVLTVPASFDEVARRLTLEAAKLAGYANLTLLEEPQAAFYSWLSLHENEWNKHLKAGDCILVCDVGGGTCDFSLIEVKEMHNQLSFVRVAVGEHLLLGGDNMDAALAHYIEEKLINEYGSQDFHQSHWLQLKAQARLAKETLLSKSKASEKIQIVLQGTGSSVVRGSFSTQLNQEEVAQLILNGFFGQYSFEEALQLRKSAGFRTMGLPYEEEPSITKHLAAFIKRAQLNKAPDYVLFNGGAMKPSLFQKAILDSMNNWFPHSVTQQLETISLDLAVARGAAYYGKVRRGLGIRIGGGTPKSYYLEIEVKKPEGTFSSQALTLLPRGSEEESVIAVNQAFFLRPNTPVSFNLYTSQVRLKDRAEDLIDIDLKELQPLPPIHTILRFGKKNPEDQLIPAQLHIKLTAIGTLELWLQSQNTDHKWTLEFQLRNAAGQENSAAILDSTRKDELFDASYLKPAQEHLIYSFKSSSKSEKMMEELEKILDKPRRDWPLSILRGLFDTLLTLAGQRKINLEMEKRWWNLSGFFLRPGIGYPLDDFRVRDFWKIILEDFKTPKSLECQIQHWICYRRIASGLSKGQQTQLANELIASLLPNKSSSIYLKHKSDHYPYSEQIRALGAFESIDVSQKIKIGKALLARIVDGSALPADYWALGRIGARHLFSGSSAHVIPSKEIAAWIKILLQLPLNEQLASLMAQLARKTDQREINLPAPLIEEILKAFSNTPHFKSIKQVLEQSEGFTLLEQEQIYGEKLPAGLILEPIPCV